jgi:heme O synthase-like polyprenyltransferase
VADDSLFAHARNLAQRRAGDYAEATIGPLPVVSADQIGTPSLLTRITAFRGVTA